MLGWPQSSTLRALLVIWLFAAAVLVEGEGESASVRSKRGSVQRESDDLRIIGGIAAGASDFPWTVYIKKIGGRGISCTGELISRRWLITAAHCLLNDDDSGYRSPRPLGNTQVVIGCNDLNSASCRTYTVRTHVAHPCYTPSVDQDHDDIALMELTTDAHLGPEAWARVDGINGSAALGGAVTLAGFGTVSNTQLVHSQHLMRVDVPVATQSFCEQQNPYSLRRQYINFSHVLCTGGKAGRDSCLGDSGGPVVSTDAAGVPWLVGVLSKVCLVFRVFGGAEGRVCLEDA